ncbi:MAG TPA: ATP-binding protein, partial [Solirubrobacteraceae bacterium]|nr:ATP-binding protein [Solirubrobacteraceae bacterium]
IGGPPASGKSTLADELARRSGWPVLSSDAVRKDTQGRDLTERLADDEYTPAARAAVYRELGERAFAAVAACDGVIVDATFGDERLRGAFLDGIDDRQALSALECFVPARLRERWVSARTAQTARGSDASPAVAARLAADHSGWDELPEEMILTVRPGAGAGFVADQVADWLDTRSVGGSTPGP